MGKIHFEKLTPKQDVDLKVYSEALDYVFKNNDIKNIAISGSYSAGKSSIIESYKNRHKEKRFMHVSLANFVMEIQNDKVLDDKSSNDPATDVGGNSTSNNNTPKIEAHLLEGKILNQILHQIDSSKIAQTNFKIKQNISDNHIVRVTGFVIISIICIFHVLFNNTWRLLVDELVKVKFLRFLDITISPVSMLISLIILIVMLSYVLFSLMKAQKNRNIFKKFSVQGNEIEILENSDESYFDKYLNEVLYLFDNSGVDVIVFEDMDRYNMNQIFQRLKEVNTLINIKRRGKGINPLKFFYLLRDDIFISKDRTKFFDFIMPAVPVIDSSNSYDQFISHFKKGGIFEKFDNQFLQRISLYVDDMRILKNIYNEFIIYNSMISEIEPAYNKLLSMIVYKNIFPKDFADTQLNKGFVSTIFNCKDDTIRNETSSVDEEITKLRGKLDLCNKEHLKDVNELGMIYFRTDYNGNRYSNIEHPEYIKRKEIIDIIENNKFEELKNQISQLESKNLEIKNKRIFELISRENEKEIFSISYLDFLGNENNFEEVKTSEYFGLIKYLIWEGHIDETYEDYMTYFYPNSLTANDKRFIRSVLDKDAKQWEYNIDNPKLVISMLREVDFRERETLNFYILDYLCSNIEDEKNKLIEFIKQLEVNKNYKFIQDYFNYTTNIIFIIKNINHYWSGFLFEATKGTEFSYAEIKRFVLKTLYYSDIDDIDRINKDGFLTDYISDDPEFLNIENPKIDQLIKEFIRLEIKFISIDYNNSNKEFFEVIYKHKLYEFSYKNIVLMLSNIYGIKNKDEIKHENYSLIMNNPTSKLSEYVIEEIDTYMSLYLAHCNDKVSDSINDALELINNENILLSKREQYLEYLTTNLKDITKISDTKLWPLLIEKNIVDYDEDNILEYYLNSGKGVDDILISFIDNNIDYKLEFSIRNIDDNFGSRKSEKLFDDIIINPDISNNKYEEILGSIGYVYDVFKFTDISNEKIKILIELRIINMTKLNLEFIRDNYNSNLIYFIESNIQTYIENIMNTSQVSDEEILKLLNRDINDEYKISLLDQISIPVTIFNDDYSDLIKEYILINKFYYNDFKELVNKYEVYSKEIKLVILSLCKKYIDNMIEDEMILCEELLILLISNEEVNKEYKISLVANNLKEISKDDFKEYISIIDYNEYLKIFIRAGNLPRVEINNHNKRLLDALQDKYWIVGYEKEENMYKIMRITKTRQPVLV